MTLEPLNINSSKRIKTLLLNFLLPFSFVLLINNSYAQNMDEPYDVYVYTAKELVSGSQIIKLETATLRISVVRCENNVSTIDYVVLELEDQGQGGEVAFDIKLLKSGRELDWMPKKLTSFSFDLEANHFDLWSCFVQEPTLIQPFFLREGSNGEFLFDEINITAKK